MSCFVAYKMFSVLRATFFLVVFTVAVTAYTAEASWFHTGVGRGACGQMHYDNEYVVALAFETFDSYSGANKNDPNHNPVCNKNLKATYENNAVVVMVVDRCANCYSAANIDLSPAAFSALADQSKGRLLGVHWDWTDLPVGPVTGDKPSQQRRRAVPEPHGKGSRSVSDTSGGAEIMTPSLGTSSQSEGAPRRRMGHHKVHRHIG
ncbi:hypothetical protein D9615_007276 [Tricholomella constricta]|uniref:RlpA-like protein double-psi beta-barrel domain-containing protein n=1 Tax=Tricholomella constricta TaxID=117010 RepID=A0A8H5M199_9AGAR|nr:hypothetical protein D9615_007276 [Tricholomella constricta]